MRSLKWLITHPNGTQEQVASLLKFYREKSLQYYDLVDSADNPNASHKGYQVKRLVPATNEDMNPFLQAMFEAPAEDGVEQLRRDMDELRKRVEAIERPSIRRGGRPGRSACSDATAGCGRSVT